MTGLAFVFALARGGEALAQAPEAPPPEVGTAAVRLAPVTNQRQFVGTVAAIQQVDLIARVEGFLDSVDVPEGSFVKAGDIVFEIEKDTYQAALEGAQATLQVATATEAGAEATLKQAQINLERQQQLLKSAAVSQSVVDQAVATRDSAAASVDQAKAQIAQAQAQIKTAQLNLSFTDVRSPIAGRIGKVAVTAGNLVSPSTGALATVVETDPIRVVFSISDSEYLGVVATLKPDDQGLPASGAAEYQPRLKLPNGQDYPLPGKIVFLDNRIDPSTGTIAVYTEFPNPHVELVPGQYVTVTVQAGQPVSFPVVPAAAIQQDRDGAYVFVLGDGNRAGHPARDARRPRRHRLGGDRGPRQWRGGHRLGHPESEGRHRRQPRRGGELIRCFPKSSSAGRAWRW